MATTIIDGAVLADAKEAERKEWYRPRPHYWLHDYLGIDPWAIKWDEAGAANGDLVRDRFGGEDPYRTHEWAGDPNPLLHTLLDIAAGHPTVVCYGNRGFSKTFTIGGGGSLWFLDVWGPCRWIVFAPTVRQSKDEGFFNEVNKMIHMEGPEGSFMDLHPRAIFNGNHFMVEPERYKTDWAATIRPATVVAGEDTAGVTKGLHHGRIVAFCEEWNEIKPAIRNGIEDTMTGGSNQLVIVANPGPEGDALHTLVQREGVRSYRGVALDFPNVVLRDSTLVPGCTSREYIHQRIVPRSAQRLGIDPARLADPDGPDYPTHHELRQDPAYATGVLAEFTTIRTNTYVPANRILAARDHVVQPEDAHEHYEFVPSDRLPMEGAVTVYAPPAWEDRTTEKREVWRRRYALYTDLAGSRAVTPDEAGDRNKRDWHAGVLMDLTDYSVAGLVRTRGFWYTHILACMWMLDRFTLRYPRDEAEAAKPEGQWTGLAKPYFGWERNIGDIPNETFADKKVQAADLGLPPGRHGWPWKSVRAYGDFLYQELSDAQDPNLSHIYGVYMTGKSRPEIVSKVGAWADRALDTPHIVRSPVVLSELGSWVEDENGKVDHADGHHDDSLFGVGGCLKMGEDLRSMGNGPSRRKWPEPRAPEEFHRLREPSPGASGPSFGSSFRSSLDLFG